MRLIITFALVFCGVLFLSALTGLEYPNLITVAGRSIDGSTVLGAIMGLLIARKA